MNSILHKAESRGGADHGWLNTKHSFSFAGYYDPERTNFGALRVLNDDKIAPGTGFGTHPHENMEIITIPLKGALEHADSTGNRGIIDSGKVQVMSAGSGIQHSEFNASKSEPLELLQIWVFPNKDNVTPRYDELDLSEVLTERNKFVQVVSPSAEDQGAWVHQDTWFHLANIDAGKTLKYSLKNPDTNGVYAFVIEGGGKLAGYDINERDAAGVWNTNNLTFSANNSSKLLLIEVPMDLH